MEILVLGTGCSRCRTLEKLTRTAVESLGIETSVRKIEDIQQIMEFGIMRTPGLVINGKVVMTGKVPGLTELKELITNNL